MLIALALLSAAAVREPLGVWQRWAALRDTPGPRCFAIAQPLRRDGTTDRRGGYALVAARPAPSVRFRLTRPRGSGAPLTLVIGERRFALVGDRAGRAGMARAGDAATDRAIVGAMRGAAAMTVTTLDARGRTLADTYPLAGAATAIDAAQLGCARR